MITKPAALKLDKNDPDVVVRSYKFALKPTKSQEQKLRQHTGAARFVYNYLISQWRDDIRIRAEEKERGVPARSSLGDTAPNRNHKDSRKYARIATQNRQRYGKNHSGHDLSWIPILARLLHRVRKETHSRNPRTFRLCCRGRHGCGRSRHHCGNPKR